MNSLPRWQRRLWWLYYLLYDIFIAWPLINHDRGDPSWSPLLSILREAALSRRWDYRLVPLPENEYGT